VLPDDQGEERTEASGRRKSAASKYFFEFRFYGFRRNWGSFAEEFRGILGWILHEIGLSDSQFITFGHAN
jgi:hypothetical protein